MSKQKKKKKHKKNKKAPLTNVLLIPDGDTAEEENLDDEDEEEGNGMDLEKEDVQLIYNALKNYKPTQKEHVLYETLFEQFEEMLVVDYGVKIPGSEFMDEEDD